MAGDPLYVCVDAGTTGTKVGAVDASGALVAAAYRGYPSSYPRPGRVEQSPDALRAAGDAAIREVLDRVDPSRVVAVACSSQRGTFVPVDAGGAALTPYLGWQDRRGVPVCEEVAARVGADAYHDATGMVLDAVAAVSKIVWLRRERADLDDRLSCYAAHQTVLLHQLGVTEHLVSPSEASYVGLLDVRSGGWHADLAAELGIPVARLPAIVPSGTRVGAVSPAAAERTGLPAGLPVVMGGGDLQLGALGVGAAAAGVVAVGIGTGGHSVAVVPEPRVDPGHRLSCLAHVVPGRWELEGVGRASGATLRWFKDVLGEPETAAAERAGRDPYEALVARMPAGPGGSAGLVVIPSWAGLGPPYNDPGFPGAVLGLRLDHDRGQLVRAFLEGITYEQRLILDVVREVTGPVDEVRAWGGAARSDAWCRLQADAYAVPVVRCREPDASVVGAAICAAVAVGAVAGFAEGAERMVTTSGSWRPDPEATAAHDRNVDVYRRAVAALRDAGVGAALAALAGT